MTEFEACGKAADKLNQEVPIFKTVAKSAQNQAAYPVVTRPPVLGSPTWRTTNAVTFSFAGLYPVEILYAEIPYRGFVGVKQTAAGILGVAEVADLPSLLDRLDAFGQ